MNAYTEFFSYSARVRKNYLDGVISLKKNYDFYKVEERLCYLTALKEFINQYFLSISKNNTDDIISLINDSNKLFSNIIFIFEETFNELSLITLEFNLLLNIYNMSFIIFQRNHKINENKFFSNFDFNTNYSKDELIAALKKSPYEIDKIQVIELFDEKNLSFLNKTKYSDAYILLSIIDIEDYNDMYAMGMYLFEKLNLSDTIPSYYLSLYMKKRDPSVIDYCKMKYHFLPQIETIKKFKVYETTRYDELYTKTHNIIS